MQRPTQLQNGRIRILFQTKLAPKTFALYHVTQKSHQREVRWLWQDPNFTESSLSVLLPLLLGLPLHLLVARKPQDMH